jgi:hypothetical protein
MKQTNAGNGKMYHFTSICLHLIVSYFRPEWRASIKVMKPYGSIEKLKFPALSFT